MADVSSSREDHPSGSRGETTAGVLFAVLLPIIGLLIGLGMLRRSPRNGLLVVALSCAGAVGWYFVVLRG